MGIREEYCLTTWDCDGIPCKILKLTPKQINFWSNKLCDTPSSFLYRKPDFTQLKEAKDSKFQLSSSCHFEELTYSGLPNTGAFSPFVRSSSFSLPSHLQMKLILKESNLFKRHLYLFCILFYSYF